MPLTVELIPDLEQGGFTACIPDIPAYGEGETKEEAIADLRSIRGYIETWGLDDAMARLAGKRESRQVDWDLTKLAHG